MLNKYIIIDTDTFLHKEGFVSSFYKTIDEAKEIAIEMLNKSGPRKLYIAEILSYNKDVCEYKMYDLENNPDFNLFDIDVSKINNQEIFNSSLYEAILANKEIEFYREMFMYYNNNKCLNFLLNFTNRLYHSRIINMLANNIDFLSIINIYNIHQTNETVDNIIERCLDSNYLNNNIIESFLKFLNISHEYDCLGYDKYLDIIEKYLNDNKCDKYKNIIKRIKKDYHRIYTDDALLNDDPLPSNWNLKY